MKQKYLQKAFELHQNGDLDEARKLYEKILPENYPEVFNLLGTLYIQKKEYKNAINILLEKEKFCGLDYESWFNLSLAYKKLGLLEKSEKGYLKALEFKPESSDVYFNLAVVKMSLEKYDDAIKCYEKCLELNPTDTEAQYFLGICYCRLKDYKNGLKNFEGRLCRQSAYLTQQHTYPKLISASNLWKGEDISDKVLYTYYEAGFGDMIMFARYLNLIKCKKIIVKPQRELVELFRENFPDMEIMDYYREDLNFDVHVPFLSIPYLLNLDNVFVSRKKYMSANPDKVKFYKKNYFNNDKFKIGIKWQGNTYYDTDRVINVEAFAKLFELNNVQVYSAQTFEGSEEFEKLSSKYDIIDLSKSFKDFSYTVAAVENMDLVICNDTSLAHLAGAMNKPCYIMLPEHTNWRWHTDLSYCDWYESVKLYKKETTWEALVDKICKDVCKLL